MRNCDKLVRCAHCNKQMRRRNLKRHTFTTHSGKVKEELSLPPVLQFMSSQDLQIMNEQVCTLHWKTHNSSMLQNLQNIRKEGTYSDATIACDGEYFAVHKLMLALGSDYFREIFSKINAESPMIIIKDIDSKDMHYILDYIYLGRADVKIADITSFADAAESLQINGIANAAVTITDMPEAEEIFGSKSKRRKTSQSPAKSKSFKMEMDSSSIESPSSDDDPEYVVKKSVAKKVKCNSALNKQKPLRKRTLPPPEEYPSPVPDDNPSAYGTNCQTSEGVKHDPPNGNDDQSHEEGSIETGNRPDAYLDIILKEEVDVEVEIEGDDDKLPDSSSTIDPIDVSKVYTSNDTKKQEESHTDKTKDKEEFDSGPS